MPCFDGIQVWKISLTSLMWKCFYCSVELVSSPLDDLCIDIWISEMWVQQCTTVGLTCHLPGRGRRWPNQQIRLYTTEGGLGLTWFLKPNLWNWNLRRIEWFAVKMTSLLKDWKAYVSLYSYWLILVVNILETMF